MLSQTFPAQVNESARGRSVGEGPFEYRRTLLGVAADFEREVEPQSSIGPWQAGVNLAVGPLEPESQGLCQGSAGLRAIVNQPHMDRMPC